MTPGEKPLHLSIQERIKDINVLMCQVLKNTEDSECYNILPFIRFLLSKYNLQVLYEEKDIFLEAYTRAVKYLSDGNIIQNNISWLKGTSFNIIRELSRKNINHRQLKNILIHSEINRISSKSSEKIDYMVETVINSFQKLNEKDRKILFLSVIQKLSFEDIGERLVAAGEEKENNDKLHNKLRQQKYKALKRLRQNYHLIHELQAGCSE